MVSSTGSGPRLVWNTVRVTLLISFCGLCTRYRCSDHDRVLSSRTGDGSKRFCETAGPLWGSPRARKDKFPVFDPKKRETGAVDAGSRHVTHCGQSK